MNENLVDSVDNRRPIRVDWIEFQWNGGSWWPRGHGVTNSWNLIENGGNCFHSGVSFDIFSCVCFWHLSGWDDQKKEKRRRTFSFFFSPLPFCVSFVCFPELFVGVGLMRQLRALIRCKDLHRAEDIPPHSTQLKHPNHLISIQFHSIQFHSIQFNSI